MIYPTAAGMVILAQFQMAPTIMPPERYDHPFAGRVDKLWFSQEDLLKVCHTWTACTFGAPQHGVCRIYLNKEYRGQWVEPYYVRHEIAHCNGWPGNHPR